MGGVNSCCIPKKSGIEDDETKKSSFRKHRRQLSATFNMAVLGEEKEELVKNKLDINTATEEELMTLPGINRETAKKIVDYRRQIKGFKVIEDLALVSGVGAVKLKAIQHEICLKTDDDGKGDNFEASLNGVIKKESKSVIVHLSSSNVFQLMKVKGIGQTLAENIVTYRDKKGPFTNIDDLIKVKGIGPNVLSAIRPQLTLDENLATDSVSYASSKKSSNLNFNTSAIPSRTSDISLHSRNNSHDPAVEFSKGSLENLVDKLGPYSQKPLRPAVEFPTFKCNNRKAVRIASWNLQCCSSEKANNPGVQDVVCMTILENGLSIIAVQELADKEALQKICDELNTPTLPNNQKWAGHRGKWKCVISESTGRMYMSNEYNGFLYDEMQGVALVSSTLLAMDKKQKPFTRRPFIATFKISGFDCALVSVHLKATGLENEDISRLQAEIDNIPNLIEAIRTALPGENDIILLGDFNLSPDTKDFDDLRNLGYHNCIADGVFTNISDANKKGSKTYDNIWISKQTKQVFTGQCDVVREGLSSPWIPKGWTWGGVVSDHCPVWAQFYTGRDLDTGDLKIGPEVIKFVLTD